MLGVRKRARATQWRPGASYPSSFVRRTLTFFSPSISLDYLEEIEVFLKFPIQNFQNKKYIVWVFMKCNIKDNEDMSEEHFFDLVRGDIYFKNVDTILKSLAPFLIHSPSLIVLCFNSISPFLFHHLATLLSLPQ